MNSAKRTQAALVFAVACISVFSCEDHSTQPPLRECDPSLVTSCDAPINKWQFLGLGNESISAIEIEPCNPQTIYVGSSSDFSAGTPGRLFRSTDCGRTWDTLLVGSGAKFRAIVLDPSNPQIIYTLPHAIVKSTDAGKSWRQITNGMRIDPETRAQSLVMDPTNPNILYAGTGGFFGGSLYKSVDGGASGRNLYQSEEITPGLQDGVVSLAIDPRNPSILYAGTAWRGLLVKSTNAGETWSLTGLGATGQIVHHILVDPKESSRVFIGVNLQGIFKSDDGGSNWVSLNEGLLLNSSVMKIQKSVLADKIFIVTTSGDSGWIYQSDQMSQWEKLGIDTLRQSYYYSDLKITPTNDLYFGTRGIFRIRLL